VRESVGYFTHDPKGVSDRKLPLAFQPIAERLALDVGHDVEDESVFLAGVVQREDMRMRENGRDLDFAKEPFGTERHRQLGPQDFDRHPPVVPEIVGEVDRSHSSPANLADYTIAGGQGSSKSLELLRVVAHDFSASHRCNA
jgi:hypothetical protein